MPFLAYFSERLVPFCNPILGQVLGWPGTDVLQFIIYNALLFSWFKSELPASTNLIASNFSSNVLLRIWTVRVVSNFVGSLHYTLHQWQWTTTPTSTPPSPRFAETTEIYRLCCRLCKRRWWSLVKKCKVNLLKKLHLCKYERIMFGYSAKELYLCNQLQAYLSCDDL